MNLSNLHKVVLMKVAAALPPANPVEGLKQLRQDNLLDINRYNNLHTARTNELSTAKKNQGNIWIDGLPELVRRFTVPRSINNKYNPKLEALQSDLSNFDDREMSAKVHAENYKANPAINAQYAQHR